MANALKLIYEEVAKCNRCGACQAVCPTYRETRIEWSVARGRIALARMMIEGKIELDDDTVSPIYECLLCKKCVESCPSGVRTDIIVLTARRELMQTKRKPVMARMALKILRKPWRLNAAVKFLGYYGRTLKPVTIVTRLEQVARVLIKANRMIEKTESASFHGLVPRLLKPTPNASHRVGYFVGCVTNHLNHAVGRATIEVLQRNGVTVEIPKALCCGLPALSYGDSDTARALARANIDLFSALDVEDIVSDCGSCVSALAEYGELLSDDAFYRDKARAFARKVKDISQYLVGIGYRRPSGEVKTSVTYHDPCHLSRYLRVVEVPRAILRSIPGIEFREMDEADGCCGAGGSYMLTHAELSTHLLDRKISNIEKTMTECVATSCPACMIHLNYGVKNHNLPMKVVHVVQVLAEAYAAEKASVKVGDYSLNTPREVVQ
ncbi:MAG: (Fe-S)-binding protein [Actinobacteria bacterium]|nr:(Fe-S)-binding protein [Actinomycetota bacterium]